MRTKWKDLTDAERVARLVAGRVCSTHADAIRQSQLKREQDALVDMAEPEWVKGERTRMFLDLSGNCEAREIRD